MNQGPERIDYTETPDVTEVHAAVKREYGEPKADVTPIPLWLAALCGAAVAWAGLYFGIFNGGLSGNVFNEYQSSPGVLFPLPQKKGAGEEAKGELPLAQQGKAVFANCQSCHQANGQGVPGQFPPLVKSEWVLGGEKRLLAVILKGLTGPITVHGEKQTYAGNMAPWEQSLTPKKIAAVASYIRAEWGNAAPEVTPADVEAAKKEFAGQTGQFTEAQLLQIPADANYDTGGAPAPGTPTAAAAAPAAAQAQGGAPAPAPAPAPGPGAVAAAPSTPVTGSAPRTADAPPPQPPVSAPGGVPAPGAPVPPPSAQSPPAPPPAPGKPAEPATSAPTPPSPGAPAPGTTAPPAGAPNPAPNPPAAAPAATPAAPVAAFDLKASVERGKPIYMQTCIACHQPTGMGLPGAFPPLAKSEYALGEPRRMIAIMVKGLQGPLNVHGVQYNNIMLPVDLQFPILKDDAKLADVANYARNSFGNESTVPVTPELVAAVRKEFAGRPTPFTEADIKAFPPAPAQ